MAVHPTKLVIIGFYTLPYDAHGEHEHLSPELGTDPRTRTTVDIAVNHHSPRQGKVERRFSRTSMRYIKSWFLLDVLIAAGRSFVGLITGDFCDLEIPGKNG